MWRSPRRTLLALTLILMTILGYGIYTWHLLYCENNRWRVQWDHGIHLPASAQQITCQGHTALLYFFGNHSSVTFDMRVSDFEEFASQLKRGVVRQRPDGNFTVDEELLLQPLPLDGEVGGRSPKKNIDYYGMRWKTIDNYVHIDFWTDWN